MSGAQYHRQSIRLNEYDYHQAGGYFVTIVTAGRVGRFGTIVNSAMCLNPVGSMVLREWRALPGRFAGLGIDAFVIMPNHIHGVLLLCPPVVGIPTINTVTVTVGAQRSGPIPSSSIDALRPSSAGHPDGGGIQERAQREGSLPPGLIGSLRPCGGDGNGAGQDNDGGHGSPHVEPGSLGAIVRAFKSSTTLRFHRMRDGGLGPLWQGNYYDHILRDAADMDRIRAYILANPTTWDCDQANPERNAP